MLLYILGVALGVVILIENNKEKKELEKKGKKKQNNHICLKAGIIGVSIWNQFCKDAKKRK